MDTITSFDDLARLFAESGLMHEPVPAESLIKLPTRKDLLDGVLFIRWEAGQQVVHFIQTLNMDVPKNRLADLALAMTILNHALFLPGFGINVALGQSYFRVTMPMRPDGTLSAREVQGLFNIVVATAAEHLAALRDVAAGKTEPMQLVPGA